MQESLRLAYLDAMGVQLWVPGASEQEVPVVVTQETAPAQTATTPDAPSVAGSSTPGRPEAVVQSSQPAAVSKPAPVKEPVSEELAQPVNVEKPLDRGYAVIPPGTRWKANGIGVLCRHEVGQPAGSFVNHGRPSKTLANLLNAIEYFVTEAVEEDYSESLFYAQVTGAGLSDASQAVAPLLEEHPPKALLLMGAATANQLTGEERSLEEWQSRQWTLADSTPFIVTYHPYDIYQSPLLKKHLMSELEMLRSMIL
ncbi:hypothetical protein [Pleionea sp. CnH1-48]|uniref:hypothetical protein n=1 Tax=Pleionea sp. CnH1-48 TaxID=2954494 RepID=UPI002096B079|nr:hypothetical protein [Pleionea sp. CnH1-48]MCO7225379.1 hypothetical protein [Pleionea sp. CnH1-48]